jgi:hypothetical protein
VNFLTDLGLPTDVLERVAERVEGLTPVLDPYGLAQVASEPLREVPREDALVVLAKLGEESLVP